MKRLAQNIGRFLKAEEVPRWFGLSLVLIYLVGLGTVARLGIDLARRDGQIYFRQSSRWALDQLAERLSLILHADSRAIAQPNGSLPGESATVTTGPLDAPQILEARRVIREFAAGGPVVAMRLIQNEQVVAAIQPAEIGIAAKTDWSKNLVNGESSTTLARGEDGTRQHIIRRALLPTGAIAARRTEGATKGSAAEHPPPTYFLEAVLPAVLPGLTGANHAGTMSVILVVLGALFITYRCLREQLRGMYRIADRLETHRSNLQHELSSLRISDTLDSVTASWNELVDLTQSLLDSVRRAEANEELCRALQKQSGGAVAEALHALPDGFIYIADEVRFEYINTAALRLMGWNPDENRRPNLREASAGGVGGRILALVRESLGADGRFQARTEVVDANEDTSSYRLTVIPLQRGRHDGQCIVLLRDVSQQLRAERAREEFVAQVTHELRTPLTNIRAYAETLSSGMFEDPKVITECYNVITKETRRLSRLIEDILSVSQLEVGSIELHLDQVDLRTLLNEGLRDLRGLADEKNIDVQLVLPAKLEPIRADRDKLNVVINNLLGNALKYTPAGGNVIVGCQVSSDSVVLTFKDNGIGIDAKDHGRIFEKFQRGNDPEVLQETGTGIGLYTAREIVRRHGGDIELISEKRKGSTFMVRLPRTESRAGSLSAAEGGTRHG